MIKNYDMSVEKYPITNLLDTPNHPYKILIISISGSGKTYVLLTLIQINNKILKKIFIC